MDRKKKLKPFILWLTGISASGKSTLGDEFQKKIYKYGYMNIKYIDGDQFRKEIKNFSYDKHSRDQVGDEKLKVAKKYIRKDYAVIVTGIANNKNWRANAKLKNKNLIEVYLKCPVNKCVQRDPKGQYKRALNRELKNFVGVTEEYEEGETADLTIETNKLSVEESLGKIMKLLKNKNIIV